LSDYFLFSEIIARNFFAIFLFVLNSFFLEDIFCGEFFFKGFTYFCFVSSLQQVQFFFDQLRKMIDSRATSSRIRFLMQDSIDLRNNNYVGRKNVVPANVKPKTLQEVHEEKRQEELAIKNAVKDLPPLPRGPQNMQGMQGGRGGPAGSQYPQRGGMQKVSSVPGSMNSLQSAQQGRGGDFGGGAKQIPTSGSAKMPSKFLNAMGGSVSRLFLSGKMEIRKCLLIDFWKNIFLCLLCSLVSLSNWADRSSGRREVALAPQRDRYV
jgi:hypothetical protein